jgi:hypothetical protein
MLRSVLAAVLLLVVGPASAQAIGHARVRVTAMSPAAVHGTGFSAKERVVVTIRGASTVMRKSVISTAAGTFTARFGRALPAAGCRGISVSAVGAKGERAVWKSAPPVCGTPLAP